MESLPKIDSPPWNGVTVVDHSCAIHIGTSGWHYQHWRGPFYPTDLPASKMLAFHLCHFDTVEINNSFYRLPTVAALESWRDSAPAGFLFAVKASRYLTHMKKLRDPEIGLINFLPRVEILGDKLGPILFQLPPRWHCNTDRLSAFLDALPKEHRYGFELRDPTWHNRAVYDLLSRCNMAFCIFEFAGFHSPIEITADFTYIRLHGPLGPYQGSYSLESLAAWARRIEQWQATLKAVYIYFDNDQAGFAAQNALQLKSLLLS